MNTGDKIAKLRKEHNYTQEQLADVLGVSRQSISKWESNIMYPETDKLIRISEIFDCSLDYLLRDSIDDSGSAKAEDAESSSGGSITFSFKNVFRERKSSKMVFGMPLWHIGKNAKGFFAVGVNASGIFAIGLKSKGVVSLGLLSVGVVSTGILSLGLIAGGVFALGAFAFGAIAAGIVAVGAIAFGLLSAGAISIGEFSLGALSIGKYFAMGDNARAMIAIGDTKAVGSVYQSTRYIQGSDVQKVKDLLDENVPVYFSWIKEIVKRFL